MLHEVIYEQAEHKWHVFGRDPLRSPTIIDTNEYLITQGDHAMLLDPGGSEIFPWVLSEVAKITDVTRIDAYLCSHQDPDIMSSLPLWMAMSPQASVYVSWLWSKFIAHFGNKYVSQFVEIPDEGMVVTLGGIKLNLVPAHYCHSSGNFHLYDEQAKILFSGDVGSALLPDGYPLFVEDFESHIAFMETFHVRWMPSNEAKNRWIKRVRRLKIDMLCPQHGALFKGPMVGQFLDWFEALEVGRAG